jgi:penicillin-binding protein 1A
VKIDPDTGLLAAPGQRNAIFEYFREEHVPEQGGDDSQSGTVTNGTDDLVRDIF